MGGGTDGYCVVSKGRLPPPQSKEPLSGMPLEAVGTPNVALHRFHPLVPGHLHHPQHVRSRVGRAGEKASPQAVTGEFLQIQPGRLGVALDDKGDGLF